ncbi:MAG: L-threonylcarbamoyladenylate synthase [Cyclobacteriaceae bacterium]|nr:L-threonylcarbamoyladenylate synthase [Cyclobacteriaceae bacterium]
MAEFGYDIDYAKKLLENDSLVAIPTETVYGLAANATSSIAVTKIFKTKERPSFDPLIIHTYSLDRLNDYVTSIPYKATLLTKRFWPGALTLLLPKKSNIPDIVTSGLDTVAVRVPNHPLTLALLKSLSFPLAAPSANPFGYISPTLAQHVNNQLGDKIEYILDGGACEVGIESTIIGFENALPTVHRLGGVSVEDIESIIGEVDVKPHSSSNPVAPGMLQNHYAPKKKLIIGNIDKLLQHHDNVGIISFQKQYNIQHQIQLSKKGDLDEAAQTLFGAMRQLDNEDISLIISEYVPNIGLGRAINDRLKRAAIKQ